MTFSIISCICSGIDIRSKVGSNLTVEMSGDEALIMNYFVY
jgi:hypothetical protein